MQALCRGIGNLSFCGLTHDKFPTITSEQQPARRHCLEVTMAENSDISHITLAVPLDELMRLKPFVSVEETRYHLNGVKFEKGAVGVVLAATDGHRLGVLRVERALVNGEGILRLPALKPKLDRLDRKSRQWL